MLPCRKRCEHIAKVEAELREKEDQVAILTADIASLEVAPIVTAPPLSEYTPCECLTAP